jgi:hypothetical protein
MSSCPRPHGPGGPRDAAAEAAPVFAASGLELEPGSVGGARADEGTGEYSEVFAIWGISPGLSRT